MDDQNIQHTRPDGQGPYEATADEVRVMRSLLETGLNRINLRIDHLIGHHDFVRQDGCPGCEVHRES